MQEFGQVEKRNNSEAMAISKETFQPFCRENKQGWFRICKSNSFSTQLIPKCWTFFPLSLPLKSLFNEASLLNSLWKLTGKQRHFNCLFLCALSILSLSIIALAGNGINPDTYEATKPITERIFLNYFANEMWWQGCIFRCYVTTASCQFRIYRPDFIIALPDGGRGKSELRSNSRSDTRARNGNLVIRDQDCDLKIFMELSAEWCGKLHFKASDSWVFAIVAVVGVDVEANQIGDICWSTRAVGDGNFTTLTDCRDNKAFVSFCSWNLVIGVIVKDKLY